MLRTHKAVIPVSDLFAYGLMISKRVLVVSLGLLAVSSSVSTVSAADSIFVAVTPCRILDTRGLGFSLQAGPPALVANTVRTFQIAGTVPGVPAQFPGEVDMRHSRVDPETQSPPEGGPGSLSDGALSGWTPPPTVLVSSFPNPDGSITETRRLTTPITDSASQFLRLKIQVP